MKTVYSPYNRTYKFICLQNQIAHNKNKTSVKSLTKTNISLSQSIEKSRHSYQRDDTLANNSSFNLIEPPRVLHLSQFYNKKVQSQQNYENERLAKRLCNVSCRVITKQVAEKDYSSHLSFKRIAAKYDESGRPKELVQLDDSLTASQVKRFNSPSQFCTLKNSRKCSTSKAEVGRNPRSKIIKLY